MLEGLLKIKTSTFFFLLSALLLVLGFLSGALLGGSTLDINVHDTYFVFHHALFLLPFFLSFTCCGLLYLGIEKLNKKRYFWLERLSFLLVGVGGVLIFIGAKYTDITRVNYDAYVNIGIAGIVFCFSALLIFILTMLLSFCSPSIQNYH